MDNNTHAQALEELVKDMGIDTLPQEKQNELLIKMTEVLLKRIFVETMEKLGESGRDEYEELMEKKPQPEELETFFAERIKNYEDVVQQIIVEFKDEMTRVG